MKLDISSTKGFTLLEIMVALAVFSLCAATALKYTATQHHYLTLLSAKTSALWIAENQLELLKLEGEWPQIGAKQKTIRSHGQIWNADITVENTPHPYLRKIIISISKQGDKSSIFSITTFLGKHSCCQ